MKFQPGTNIAKHVVFVEGNHDEAIDPIVIKELLKHNDLPQIDVKPMGGCDNVRSAAQALIRTHPTYYFLIDRDDQNQETVEQSWQDFPNPEKYNLLIWRKRELENYFIAPDYIEKSDFLKKSSRKKLREIILSECNRRLFLDAANLTLMYLNREMRKPFAEHFREIEDFKDREAGIVQLENCQAIIQKQIANDSIFDKVAIREKYKAFVNELNGGVDSLQYGVGTWLERMSGKEIFHFIANSCFQVKSADGKSLQGKERNKQIAKQLLTLSLDQQPEDFQQIVKLLQARVV